MTQIERIQQMEQTLDAGAEAIRALSEALEQYLKVNPDLEVLFDYYSSPQWMQDFDDDTAGKLPHGLKRGVLSEDAVYDLLTERAAVLQQMREIVGAQ